MFARDARIRVGCDGTKPGGGYLAPALNGSGHAWHHPPEMLFKIIRDGSPAEESAMLGWRDRMNDSEIREVLAYLFSLWPQEISAPYKEQFGG